MRLRIAMTTIGTLALALALAACNDQANGGDAGSRDQIKIVGSSTIYPFTTLVAEQFVNKNPGNKAPVVESTGTGGGIKLFCGGVGARFPDIANASRRITAAEYQTCETNGVNRIMEVQIGLDGIAFATATNGPKLQLTPADVYLALAATPRGAKNTAKTWKDVNPSLPATPIQVYGPPATSGTRDALVELILARGCEAIYPDSIGMKTKKPADYDAACKRIRDDGAYSDAGENDNLIVQKLQSNPNAIGIFGYSYLEENGSTLAGVPIGGVLPSYETIAAGTYPGSRPLYIYVKKAHIGAIRGLDKFVELYTQMIGPEGPLVKRGLIAAPQPVRDGSAEIVKKSSALNPDTLK